MNIKNLMRNIWALWVLCRFAKTVVLRFFFFEELNLRSLYLLPLWSVAKPLRDFVFFFSFRVSCIRSLQMQSSWKQRGTLLKCADVWWCIVRGNAVGTQELFVYFLQRNFDMGVQSCANKAWQPLTDFRGPGQRRRRGEVNRQTPPHQSLQPGEAQEAKPADPLQGSDPSMPFSW